MIVTLDGFCFICRDKALHRFTFGQSVTVTLGRIYIDYG